MASNALQLANVHAFYGDSHILHGISFSGLAPMIVNEIVKVLKILKNDGLAILMVEQNLHTALAIADRHHVVNKGTICFTGSSAELEHNEFVMRNYLSV